MARPYSARIEPLLCLDKGEVRRGERSFMVVVPAKQVAQLEAFIADLGSAQPDRRAS